MRDWCRADGRQPSRNLRRNAPLSRFDSGLWVKIYFMTKQKTILFTRLIIGSPFLIVGIVFSLIVCYMYSVCCER